MKVIVTGASKGLGKALVNEFLGRGAEVWGVARSPVERSAYAGAREDNFTYSRCDLTVREDVRKLAGEMKARAFIPDIIVLNAK